MRHIFFFSSFRSLNINLPTHVQFIKVFMFTVQYTNTNLLPGYAMKRKFLKPNFQVAKKNLSLIRKKSKMASEKLLPFLLTLTDVILKVMCLLFLKSFGSEKIRREVSCPKLRDRILINAGDRWIDLKEIVGRTY